MTSLQPYTIPSQWTAPTSCFATTNYYFVRLSSGYYSNMYGTPTPVLDGNTPTGDCIPPSFSINEPYTTDGDCPSGYTRACATRGTRDGAPVSTVTCCPSVTSDVFSFMCRDHEYGCHATATKGVVWTGRVTDIGLDEPTDEPVTRTPSADEGIEAWGIKFIQISPTTATEAGETMTTPAPGEHQTSGQTTSAAEPSQSQFRDDDIDSDAATSSSLSPGAIAGVVIGGVLAIVLLGVLAVVLIRYRRRSSEQPTSHDSPASYHEKRDTKTPTPWQYQQDGLLEMPSQSQQQHGQMSELA